MNSIRDKRKGKHSKNNDCNGEMIRTILIKVEKLETDMEWVKKFIYAILGILLSLFAKIIIGG